MGFLRLWFALAVAGEHASWSGIPAFLYGPTAVQAFYALSGFYIQYCIHAYRGQPNWALKFYASRLWRLFPVYYIILLLTVVYTLSTHARPEPAVTVLTSGNALSIIAFVWSNLFILGQDLLRFLTVNPATGALVAGGYDTAPSHLWGSSLALLGQAWTLALELIFYLLAPWLLLRSGKTLLVFALLSLLLKIGIWEAGHRNPINWGTAFFPAELWIFIAGALVARLQEGRPLPRAVECWKLPCYLLLAGAVVAASYAYPRFGGHSLTRSIAFIFLVLGVAYLLGRISRSWRWERFVGELSYPIYISHILVIRVLSELGAFPHALVLATYGICILLSVALVLGMDRPLSRFRHRRYRAGRAA